MHIIQIINCIICDIPGHYTESIILNNIYSILNLAGLPCMSTVLYYIQYNIIMHNIYMGRHFFLCNPAWLATLYEPCMHYIP